MTERRNIIIGNQSNDGTGDSVRDAFDKVNKNFVDIYDLLGAGNGFSFLKLKEAPASLRPSTASLGRVTVLGVDEFGRNILNKTLMAGTGISLTLYDDTIIINNTSSSLVSQTRPVLGGNLDGQNVYSLINMDNSGPIHDYDAVSRKWVYQNFVSRDGATVYDVGVDNTPTTYPGGSRITGNVNIDSTVIATSSTHLVSKGYVDGKISLGGISTYDAELGAVNEDFGQMTGALRLFRDPIETDHPNTAATKHYVDNTGFVSRTNFFVSLSGNDNRVDIPGYKKGRGWNYAFKTINRAAQAAEQYLEASQITLGPYQKTISKNDNQDVVTVSEIGNSTVLQPSDHGVRLFVEIDTADGTDPYINGSIFPGLYIVGARTGAVGRLEKISHDTGGSTGNREIYDIVPVDYGLTFTTPLEPISGVNTATVVFKATSPNLISFPDFWVGYKFTRTDNQSNVIAQGTITEVGSDYTDLSNGNVYDTVTVDFSDGIALPSNTILIDDGVFTTATWHVYAPDFNVLEELIWGQRQVREQITICIESGEHEEQYPVKIGENVSLRGDEFRRSVIKPAKLYGSQLASISHSKWSNMRFYRDTQVDGIITVQLDKTLDYAAPGAPGVSTYLTATPSSETPDETTGAIIFSVGITVPSNWVGKVFYMTSNPLLPIEDQLICQGVIIAVVGNTFSVNIAQNSAFERKIPSSANIVNSSVTQYWHVYNPINFGWHYLRDASRQINVLTTLTNLGGFINAASALSANKEFIQDEIVQWFDDNYLFLQTNWASSLRDICKRDTGLIVDAIAQDMLFNGTSQTTFAGIQYWAQSGYTGQVGSEITTTTNAISYVKLLAGDIIRGLTPLNGGLAPRYPSSASQTTTNPATATEKGIADADFDVILNILNNGVAGVTDNIVPNGLTPSSSSNINKAYTILQANKEYIQYQTIAYITATYPAFTYNQETCFRDVGYMIDSVSFDLLYPNPSYGYSNRQAIQSGVYYYNYTNTTQIPGEISETIAAYQYLKSILPNVVRGIPLTSTYQTGVSQTLGTGGSTLVGTLSQSLIDNVINIINNGPDQVTEKSPIGLVASGDTNVINGATLLLNNRTFLKEEISAFVDNQLNFTGYDPDKSRRDAGSIVSGLIEDLTLGGWWRTVNNGDSIVSYVTSLTTACVATINQIGNIASDIISNDINAVYPSNRVLYNVIGTYSNYTNTIEVNHSVATSVAPGWTFINDILPNGYTKIVSIDTSTNLLTLDLELVNITPFETTTTNTITITPQTIQSSVSESLAESRMRDLIQACAGIVNSDTNFNPPKYTDEMDCFLMNDSTMIRYVSCQGHGGFMKVLDPTGQILAKSPYTQTASSFSKSYNRHVFSGGMFVDGYSGNLTALVQGVENDTDGNPTKIRVSNLGRPNPNNYGTNISYLRPQTPCFFTNQGITYEVDFISEWNPVANTGVLNLNPARAGGVYTVTNYTITGFKSGAGVLTVPLNFSAPSSPGGVSAYGTARISNNGNINSTNFPGSLLVTFSGSGYKTIPTFVIGGALLSFEYNSSTGISNIKVVKPGAGYKASTGAGAFNGTRINFNTPTVTGAIAAVGWVLATDSNGGILTAEIQTAGFGYSTANPPSYTFGTFSTAPGTVELKTGFVSASLPSSVTLITAGNRSMLANDFTQLNDLGYGIFATNGGFVENVSMFTYYCHTSYYALNGAQMRTITGSSAYGDYGLIAEGSDPGEIPISVTNKNPTSQIITTYSSGTYVNLAGGTDLYITYNPVTNYIPLPQSVVDINHQGIIKTYNVKSATLISGNLYALAIDNGAGGGLIASVTHQTSATIRLYYEQELIGLKSSAISRPSTVLTFAEDPNQVYRILSYTDEGNDTVLGEADTPYNYINLNVYSNSAGVYRQGIGNVSWYDQGTVGSTPVGVTSTGSGYLNATYSVTFNPPAILSRTAIVNGDFGTQEVPVDLINVTTIFPSGAIHPGMTVTSNGSQNGFSPAPTVLWASSTQVRLSNSVYGLTSGTTLTFTGAAATGQAHSNAGHIDYIAITDPGVGYEVTTLAGTIGGGAGAGGAQVTASIQGIVGSNSFKVKPLSSIEAARIATGLVASTPYYYYFAYEGKLYRITGYSGPKQTQSPGNPGDYGEVRFVLDSDGTSGLQNEIIPGTLFAGIGVGQTGGITVKISTLRATSHDMVAVGTGGYADSKIPNDLYGPPNKGPYPDQEVKELGKGRVYFVTTDQDGNFRVGKFFGVDQGRGTVSISAPISLTNVDGISFRRGDVLVNRFSTDGTMAAEATNKVPVEQAIVSYVNKRLGIDKDSNVVNPIGPGFLPLNGTRPMGGDLDMANHKINNLYMSGTDEGQASNKGWTDRKIDRYGTDATDNDLAATRMPQWGRMLGPLWGNDDPKSVNFTGGTNNLASTSLTTTGSPGLHAGQFIYGSGVTAGTTILGGTGNSWTLSQNCTIPNGTSLVAADPPLQVATKRYVDRRTQIATLNDVDLIDPVDQDILMFSSSALAFNTSSVRPIWSATNQVINVSLDNATITNTPAARSGGSDVTFARSGNSLTIKLVGGAGSNNPITDYHVNSDAQIAQSKLFMTTATTATSFPTGNQRAIQAKLGVAQFDSSYFALTNGWATFNIDNDLYPITDNTKLLGKSTNRWANIYGALATINTLTISDNATLNSLVVTNNARVGGIFTSTGNLIVGINKFVVTAATGDTSIVGDLGVDGGLTVGGSTSLAGLTAGATTLNSLVVTNNARVGGIFTSTGNLIVGVDKFIVNATNGNTEIKGSLTVRGDTQLDNNLTVGNNKFTVNTLTGYTKVTGSFEATQESKFVGIRATIITATTFVGNLSGDVTGNITSANKVNHKLTVGAHLAFDVDPAQFDGSADATISTDATDQNTASAIVSRNNIGCFAANTVTVKDLVLGNSTNYLIGTNVWAGSNGYPGYLYSGGTNSRFGFSASGASAVDVYADGEFYSSSTYRVLSAGNYNNYSPTLTGVGASGNWSISITGGQLGSVLYQSGVNATSFVSPNVTTTRKFLAQVGDNTNSTAPTWNTITAGDIPTLNQNTTGNARTASTVTNTVDAGAAIDLVYGVMAANDAFRIRIGGASDAGWAELATNDNGNEPIYVRQYSGAWATVNKEATLLDANGDTIFPGNVYAGGPTGGGTFYGTASKANYADLAERYTSDTTYEPGTVLIFGGIYEVTISSEANDRRIAGIVSSNPAFLMNNNLENGVSVALTGRVPCRVVGTIKKGDLMVSSHIPGVAMANNDARLGTVIGKALEDYDSEDVGTIEVVAGRL